MEPARSIIALLGGEAVVARIAGVSVTGPYRWQQARTKGGTGGVIPHWHVVKLLEHARKHEIDLTPASFAPVFGAGDGAAQMARASA